METHADHSYRGGSLGPIAAIALLAVALLLLGGLELEMFRALAGS